MKEEEVKRETQLRRLTSIGVYPSLPFLLTVVQLSRQDYLRVLRNKRLDVF